MVTILLTAKVSPDDVDDAVKVAANLGYEARPIGGVVGTEALVLFETLALDEETDNQALQEQVSQQITAALTEHGVPHQLVGVASDNSSITKSTFTIRPIGATDSESDLEIRANNRREFEQRLGTLHYLFGGEEWPPQDLNGHQVIVEGLAAGDPDVQQPPFIPKRP